MSDGISRFAQRHADRLGTIVLERRYDPAQTLATIEAKRIRYVSGGAAAFGKHGSSPAILRRRAIACLGPERSRAQGSMEKSR
jgi:hypothetical protein